MEQQAAQPRDAELARRLEVAQAIVREAGELTLTYFGQQGLDVERKADDSPVTVADREAERLLRRQIATTFPHDAVIGEELGDAPGSTGYRWVIDPIDGTKSFVAGVPLYTTLLGLLFGDQSVAGVLFAPALDELVYASSGNGAWYVRSGGPPQPARVSEVDQLCEGLLVTTEVATFQTRPGADGLDTFIKLQQSSRLTRTWGDGYGYLLVATGRAEAMVDPVMNLWDAAAVAPIVAEAGGTFTDWQGRPTVHSGEGIGTNSRVLDQVLAMTKEETGR